ncbi:MAG: hypothetical protein V3S82_05225, partial [Dehalococcoidia bacterium]
MKQVISPEQIARTARIAAAAAETATEATIEIVGAWCWITFASKPEGQIRTDLVIQGWKYSARRRQWFNPCGVRTGRMQNGHPRDKYGSIM